MAVKAAHSAKTKVNVEELREILMQWGITGFEGPVREFIHSRVKNLGKTRVDAVGNLWLTLPSSGPKPRSSPRRIAFIAHLDELGLVVSNILPNGRVKFKKVGGIDDRILPGRHIEARLDNGKVVEGAVTIKPPHLSTPEDAKQVITADQMEIFFGTFSEKDTRALGLNILTPMRMKKDFFQMTPDLVTCRALDDRAGCYMVLEIARALAAAPLPGAEVFCIWTVQEEYGLRGARAVAQQLALSHPDQSRGALTESFDETYILDTISSSIGAESANQFSDVKNGAGPVIRFLDRAAISSEPLWKKAEAVARKHGIPVQRAVSGGTTDAAALFEGATATLPISPPIAFTHSMVETCSLTDLGRVIDLCIALAHE